MLNVTRSGWGQKQAESLGLGGACPPVCLPAFRGENSPSRIIAIDRIAFLPVPVKHWIAESQQSSDDSYLCENGCKQ